MRFKLSLVQYIKWPGAGEVRHYISVNVPIPYYKNTLMKMLLLLAKCTNSIKSKSRKMAPVSVYYYSFITDCILLYY